MTTPHALPLLISRTAFRDLQGMFDHASGIRLAAGKQTLVASRLRSRLEKLGLADFDAYCEYLKDHGNTDERQRMIDLLTTNETYFFREPEHFTVLAEQLKTTLRDGPLRIWSAASSTGEEPYSIAMTLASHRVNENWEIVATDLSSRVLDKAQRGLYLQQRLEQMPKGYVKRFFLRGTGQYEGFMLLDKSVRQKVSFVQHNLLHDAQQLGSFDVAFLRNVMIYFDQARKQEILMRVIQRLRSGGWLFVGHAESLHGHELPLQRVGKSVYRKR